MLKESSKYFLLLQMVSEQLVRNCHKKKEGFTFSGLACFKHTPNCSLAAFLGSKLQAQI
jgi:hypothetical protein